MVDNVRVRIAPSPTGDPHVGLAYTTLFNYVVAKKYDGKLILRIEDTDQTRAKASSDEMIMDSLKWLGLEWDEGPDVGGEYGPYRQSLRKEIYAEKVKGLVEKGAAYPCFCSPERLEEVRQRQRENKEQTGYDRKCRDLDPSEAKRRISAGDSHVFRLKMPLDGETSFRDEIRGEITIPNKQMDDTVLVKADGFPTYHFANVVDDKLMKITHVIRAEEWINSTPKHVCLYHAFGWDAPKFAHLPLLRNPDKSKISKRKSPVSLNYYKEKGILPEAMQNFLGLMGWAFSGDQDIFTLEQMQEKFEFKDIHLGGPVFDVTKLQKINQHYVLKQTDAEFVDQLVQQVFSKEYLMKIAPLMKERTECSEQFVEKASFFFTGALDLEGLPIIPKKKTGPEMRTIFKSLLEKLDDLYVWTEDEIQNLISEFQTENALKPRDFLMPLRLITTGRKDSPPLAATLAVMGRERVRFRMRNALQQPMLN